MARKGNFNVFSAHAWYVPGMGGMFVLLAFLLGGALLGNIVSLVFMAVGGPQAATDYAMLVSYPLLFIPAMFYVAVQSRNQSLDHKGYSLDNSHFGSLGGWLCALLAMVGTFAAAFSADVVISLLPPIPDWLRNIMANLTGGVLWVNFLLVSIMAPLFEEWLCRGMVLRGLLNSGKMKPGWAIVVSAVFFALIHANPWQAVPAFVLGCLFGYVYYRTGSLKLTMLMHFTNNTIALACAHIWPGAESWMDVLGRNYTPLCLLGIVVAGLVVLAFSKIETQSPEGNCDSVAPLFTD